MRGVGDHGFQRLHVRALAAEQVRLVGPTHLGAVAAIGALDQRVQRRQVGGLGGFEVH